MVQTRKLFDLDINQLNENDAGVGFRVLDSAGIDALKFPVPDWKAKVCGLTPKAAIRQWHVIELRRGNFSGCVLVGYKVGFECRVTCTSFIVAMAPDGRALITENGSLYQLRMQGIDQPDYNQVIGLASTLRSWGMGTLLRPVRMLS